MRNSKTVSQLLDERGQVKMTSLFGFVSRNWQVSSPPEHPKAVNALKFGILGAANIAWVLRLLVQVGDL